MPWGDLEDYLSHTDPLLMSSYVLFLSISLSLCPALEGRMARPCEK